MSQPKGDDALTCFLSGFIGIVVFGSLLVFTLSFIFD